MSPLVIAHLSDLHFGAHDPAVLDALVADVTAARPDLVVVTGDSTMRARRREFAQARAFLDRLPTPRLVIPGNHDIAPLPPARFLDPHVLYRAGLAPDPEPRLDLPGVRALGLATTPPWRWKNGRLTRRQCTEVATFLGTAPPGVVRVLALHHPPFATGTARLIGRGRLRRVLAEHPVDLILAGHTHLPTERRLQTPSGRTVVVLVAGTATSTRIRGNTRRSWTLITAGAGTIDVRLQTEPG